MGSDVFCAVSAKLFITSSSLALTVVSVDPDAAAAFIGAGFFTLDFERVLFICDGRCQDCLKKETQTHYVSIILSLIAFVHVAKSSLGARITS